MTRLGVDRQHYRANGVEKISYRDRVVALASRKDAGLAPYQCFCGAWHLGHPWNDDADRPLRRPPTLPPDWPVFTIELGTRVVAHMHAENTGSGQRRFQLLRARARSALSRRR